MRLIIMYTVENHGEKRPLQPSDEDDDGGGGGKRPAVKPAPSSDEEERDMCYLCFGEGPDESGQPLRRDCSCRGGSGFAHLSCIVGYAKRKSDQWDGWGPEKFAEQWHKCPNCKQDYQNELSVELVSEFASFVAERYPDDQVKTITVLDRKLFCLLDLARQQPVKREEAKQIANKILSIIEQVKNADPTRLLVAPEWIVRSEAGTYNLLGSFAMMEGIMEGTTEGEKIAIEYFEKCQEIFNQPGVSVSVRNTNWSFGRKPTCPCKGQV